MPAPRPRAPARSAHFDNLIDITARFLLDRIAAKEAFVRLGGIGFPSLGRNRDGLPTETLMADGRALLDAALLGHADRTRIITPHAP